MKKVFCLFMVMALLMVFGCGKASVEDVTKDYVKKSINFDNGIRADTSKLEYEVIEKTETSATVQISGTVDLVGKIYLVKEGKDWKVADGKPAPTGEPVVGH